MFSRFRRAEHEPDDEQPTVPHELLPHVNQRVTVWARGRSPEPSRVEDETGESIVLSAPSQPIEDGEPISLTWEGDDCWFRFETTAHIEPPSLATGGVRLPTVVVSSKGHLSRFDERRKDLRARVHLDLNLRVVMARGLRAGLELSTHTIDLGTDTVTFETTAPLQPGDMLEARITLEPGEWISARLKITRVDVTSGGVRQRCMASYDDILRSDRSRIGAYLEAIATT
jgi:hypothetical protein